MVSGCWGIWEVKDYRGVGGLEADRAGGGIYVCCIPICHDAITCKRQTDSNAAVTHAGLTSKQTATLAGGLYFHLTHLGLGVYVLYIYMVK